MIDPEYVWLMAQHRRAVDRLETAQRDVDRIERLMHRLKAAAERDDALSKIALDPSMAKKGQWVSTPDGRDTYVVS